MEVLAAFALAIFTTAFWELWLRDAVLPHFRRARYSLRRGFAKEPPLSTLLATMRTSCGPNEITKKVMSTLDAQGLAIDGCFELVHSHGYRGWTRDDIEFVDPARAVPLPGDLLKLANENQPAPPNHGKYRLYHLVPDSSERPRLQIQLSPTNYFLTYPIQRRLFNPVLRTSGGDSVSPFDLYQRDLLHFKDHPLPSMVCLHTVVLLRDNKLLLTQRMKRTGAVDWELGKWASSFEEQMTIKTDSPEPRIDRDFFDTVFAGLREEVGVEQDAVDEVRILSLLLEADGIVVDPVALVTLHQPFEEVEAHWHLKARDGAQREIRKVDWIPFTLGATVPILMGQDLLASTSTIRSADWHVTSRMRLLTALFHRYGINATLQALAKAPPVVPFRPNSPGKTTVPNESAN